MDRIILNLKTNDASIILAAKAGKHLLDHTEKEDALLEYGDAHLYYVKRNKKSISVWEQ